MSRIFTKLCRVNLDCVSENGYFQKQGIPGRGGILVFDHWTVTETDENSHSKAYTFDAFQRLKQVVENNSGASYTTNYTYSPLGELTTIYDHADVGDRNTTSISYDSLGRKTQMSDPDMATWNYSYDGVGNLISQRDSR